MRQYLGGFALRTMTAGNTQVRRLGYLTAICQILLFSTPNADSVMRNLLTWAREHQGHLNRYASERDGQGAINPDHLSGARRYLDVADGLQLVARTERRIELSRFGELLRVLSSLKETGNPFYLSYGEILFYTYWLLLSDADFLLLVMDAASEGEGLQLTDLQAQFQRRFIERLEAKWNLVSDTVGRQEISNAIQRAREMWQVPERYAEHIVPTRASWLLDLGFLEPKLFKDKRYALNSQGKRFREALPQIPSTDLRDVTGDWLWNSSFASILESLKGTSNKIPWSALAPQEVRTILEKPLQEACQHFRLFGMHACSMLPALIYCVAVLTACNDVQVNLADIVSWESKWGTNVGFPYRFHLSPLEENSYIEMINYTIVGESR